MADNKHEQQHIQATSKPAPDTTQGGPKATASSELELFKEQLRAEMRAELNQAKNEIREQAREQLNEEREVLHAQVDAARAEALSARQQQRANLKPADFGNTTLLVNDPPAGPTARRAARPLPAEGIVELELTHGSFVGTTADKTFWQKGWADGADSRMKDDDSHEPALPGEILRFDMKVATQKKTAQMLRDSGCAERI